MKHSRLAAAATTVGTLGYLYCGWPTPGTAIMIGWILLLLGIHAGLTWWHYGRPAARVIRAADRARRKHGVASTLDLIRFGSAWAVRRKSRVVRPSVGSLTWVGRRLLPTTATAVLLCAVGWIRVWASVEDAVLVLGGPRKGKSGWLAGAIVDAPGAVISTSTRRQMIRLTSAARARIGPVYVFNPGGLGGVESTLAFDPLDGCTDPQVATETAVDMIPASTGEGERWDEQARRTLAVLLYAAALADLGIGAVAEWAANPGNPDYHVEIYAALRRGPDPSPHIEEARQFLTNNERTRSSITTSIMPALAWLRTPNAVASLEPGPTSDPTVQRTRLDVPRLLAERGTVYLLGRHEAHTAGLLAALTGRVIRQSRNIAAYLPGDRLDPPLLLALDEAARIAPIDLPEMSGDCGGSGIILIGVLQSIADAVNRWGEAGAGRLLTNCGIRLLFGGSADPDELEGWAKLADLRDEVADTYDSSGHKTGSTTRAVATLSVPLLANPGPGRVALFHRDMLPVIGHVTMFWARRPAGRFSQWRSTIRPPSATDQWSTSQQPSSTTFDQPPTSTTTPLVEPATAPTE